MKNYLLIVLLLFSNFLLSQTKQEVIINLGRLQQQKDTAFDFSKEVKIIFKSYIEDVDYQIEFVDDLGLPNDFDIKEAKTEKGQKIYAKQGLKPFTIRIKGEKIIRIGSSNKEKEEKAEKKTDDKPDLEYTGIAFWDAQILSNCDTATGVAILKKYDLDTTNIKDHPFLNVLTEFKGIDKIGAQSSRFTEKASGIDVTNVVNAISNIMINHAKEELTVAFFNRFKKFAEKNPEFKVMFPKTTNNLNNLLSYKYTEMLSVLRIGFLDDLCKLPYHLDDVLELPKYRELLKKFPEIRVAIRSIMLIQSIESDASNAADIIKEFSEFKEWNNDSTTTHEFQNMGNTIKLAAIFSESLRNNNDTSIWIKPTDAKKLISNDTVFNIYLGLIYQRVKDKIKFRVKINARDTIIHFTSFMKDNIENLEILQSKVSEFLLLANKVDLVFEKKLNGEKLTNEDYYNYINLSIDLIDYSFAIAQLFNESIDAKEYMAMVKQSNNLYRNIYNKQYAQAILDGTDILLKVYDLINKNTLSPDSVNISSDLKKNKRIEKLANGTSWFINKKIKKAREYIDKNGKTDTLELHKLIINYDSKQKLEGLIKFVEKVRPYALFIANTASAKTSEEIEAALENVILPVGSSSIKKNSDFNFSVQSYLGGYYNLTTNNHGNTSWNDEFGVHGPIGLSVSYGLKRGGAVSIFGSVFDIGAIIDFKLTSDSVSTSGGQNTLEIKKESQIKLGQIFSPGVFAVYGLPWNIPLSIGYGLQYGPGLSKIEADGSTVINNPCWRQSLFLSVDIPLFSIFNISKRKPYKRRK